MSRGTKDDESVTGADSFSRITGGSLPEPYVVVRELGRGSMAHVFLVRNQSLQRLAAIKVLSPDLADDEVSRKRFVREARAAARITHPNVTSVYTVGTLGNGLPFIEMQYVEGPNLAELVRSQGPLEPSRATSLLIQIAGALAAAHDCRVIHRDVKPANVLIDREQTHAFLTDFGVAGILETGTEAITRLTRASDRLGNPDYMSPEQLRGESITEHSDVYSFGILGYELLTGHGPFGASEVGDVAAAHIRKMPLDLHESYPRIPAALADALKRCLAKKPEHRPSARVLADLLRDDQPAVVAEPVAGSGPTNAFTDFLAELQKRRVYRAAATYGVVTFAVLQGADLILPALDTGDAVYRVLVIAFLSGFPVAMWLSWVYDLNRGRLERADDLDASFARRASRGQRIALQSLGLALSVGIAIGIAVWLL